MHAGPRQRQILECLVLGQTDKQIAGELGISITTVRTYLVRLYRDNGFSNRTDAATSWLRVRTLEDILDLRR
jgi:DNA-binding NarL/FixJ family response regulator